MICHQCWNVLQLTHYQFMSSVISTFDLTDKTIRLHNTALVSMLPLRLQVQFMFVEVHPALDVVASTFTIVANVIDAGDF
jgi:hypothetical protein